MSRAEQHKQLVGRLVETVDAAQLAARDGVSDADRALFADFLDERVPYRRPWQRGRQA